MVRNIPENMKRSFERTAHPYYFYESLMSTPEGLEKILEPSALKVIEEAAKKACQKKIVYLTGNGTSYYNALATPYMLDEHTSIISKAMPAYELQNNPPNHLDEDSCVIGISHSGNSIETTKALEFAQSKGALTIAITDNEKAKMHQYADISIYSENDEKQGPKNRSYIASVLRTHLFSLFCARLQGKDITELLKIYKESPAIVEDVLKQNDEPVKEFSNDLAKKPYKRFMNIGTGFQYPTCCENSLKMSEVSMVPGHAWELEESLHGFWYSMSDGELMIVHAIEGPAFDKSKLLVNGIREIAETIWVVTNSNKAFENADFVTRLPKNFPDSFYALLSVIPGYFFTYYFTLARGKSNPDHGPYDDQRFIDARWILRQIEK